MSYCITLNAQKLQNQGSEFRVLVGDAVRTLPRSTLNCTCPGKPSGDCGRRDR